MSAQWTSRWTPPTTKTLYASLWGTRRPPWSVYAPSNLPGGGLYKSTDGGDSWTKLAGGLPTDSLWARSGSPSPPAIPAGCGPWWTTRAAAVAKPLRNGGAPSAEPPPQTGGGVYTSDDAGATWKLVNGEQRLWGRGWYFESVAVDPVNPDRAYVINTGTYETRDGGKTFVPVKGSPGGDDDHQMWINPRDGNRMVLSHRPGHGDKRRRRADLEHLVQPAHGADLPCGRQQRLARITCTAPSRIPAPSA